MDGLNMSKGKLLDRLVKLHINETKYLHFLIKETELKKQYDKHIKRKICIANSIVQGSLDAIDRLTREV